MSRRAAFALTLLLVASTAGAASKSERVGTDAWTIVAPAKPWTATTTLEPAGERSWSFGGTSPSRARLKVGYVSVLPRDRGAAVAELLGIEKAAVVEALSSLAGTHQGPFELDSMAAPGGFVWRGFHVNVATERQGANVWRWVALHPRFPAVRRAYTLNYDESFTRGAATPGQLTTARAVAASLMSNGRGLAGPLDEAWLDARASAFAARIDSAQKLCWSNRSDGVPGQQHIGYGRGLAIEGDFYLISGAVPRDSLVDAAPSEYGTAFDRNGDDRLDLLVVNRGIQPFPGKALEPTVAIYADDDFDGRIDGIVAEDVDKDSDKRVDARLLVKDPDENGRTDEARAFVSASTDGEKLALEEGGVKVRRAELPSQVSDFSETYRQATLRLAELQRARGSCPQP